MAKKKKSGRADTPQARRFAGAAKKCSGLPVTITKSGTAAQRAAARKKPGTFNHCMSQELKKARRGGKKKAAKTKTGVPKDVAKKCAGLTQRGTLKKGYTWRGVRGGRQGGLCPKRK